MSCQRCHGLLIPENFGELRDELGRICLATRCVNCGCIDDSVVRANRLRHLPKRSVSQGQGHNWRSRVPATPFEAIEEKILRRAKEKFDATTETQHILRAASLACDHG